MHTVQEWLREIDIDRLCGAYLFAYPVDFAMLEDKSRPVSDVLDRARENLRKLILSLRKMPVTRNDDSIFFAVSAYGEDRRPMVQTMLAHCADILKSDLPTNYAWDFTEWEETLGALVADTKLTRDHIETVLAQIIEEMTFFGYDYDSWKRRKDEVENSLREAEDEISRGEYLTEEEVFSQFGLPKDEPDELADELSRKVAIAEMEYNNYFIRRETLRIQQLLLEN